MDEASAGQRLAAAVGAQRGPLPPARTDGDDRSMGRTVITARAAATFEPVGRSVASARAFVRDTLQGWGLADIVDDAVVLTSELVTNAVVHAWHRRRRPVPARRRRKRTSGGRRPLPRPRAARPGPGPPLRRPRPRGRPRPAAVRLARRPLGCGVHRRRQARLVPPGAPRAPGRHPQRRSRAPRQRPAHDRHPGARRRSAGRPRLSTVSAWNDDARELFGYTAEQVTGKPLTDLAAWPHTPGIGTGIAEALALSRWEGSYGVRGSDGRTVPVYASHLRVRDADGEPSTVCLLVRDHERAVLQSPTRGAASDSAGAPESRDRA
ncbi:PAS domain-containing protein [Streptomyces radiopugnans]|nr:PAS domain-containing protein [Streptomyces radiopugnans]